MGEARRHAARSLSEVQAAELGHAIGWGGQASSEEGRKEEGLKVRIAGVGLALVGFALVVFYVSEFSFSGSGEPDRSWRAQAEYSLQSRIGITAGAILLAAGLFIERERRRK